MTAGTGFAIVQVKSKAEAAGVIGEDPTAWLGEDSNLQTSFWKSHWNIAQILVRWRNVLGPETFRMRAARRLLRQSRQSPAGFRKTFDTAKATARLVELRR